MAAFMSSDKQKRSQEEERIQDHWLLCFYMFVFGFLLTLLVL